MFSAAVTDINECKSTPCSAADSCINVYGSYYCITSNGQVVGRYTHTTMLPVFKLMT